MSPRRRQSQRQRRSFARHDQSQVTARKHRPDYMLVIYMTLLLAIGAVTVYAISPGITAAQGLSETYYSYKQLLAIGLGVVAFLIAAYMKTETWKKLELPLMVAASVVSLAVRLFGDPVNGAYRWLDVAGVSFQAAELIKFALIIWLASYLLRRRQEQKLQSLDTMKKLGIAVAAVAVVVAGLQSDLGSAAVMLAIIGGVAYIAGLPLKKLLIVSVIIVSVLGLFITVSPYRRERVATYLNPAADCQDEGYQACQALITVGSGGMFGKGLGRSVQAYGYLPEAANDSIFAIVSEKFGFIGATGVVGLFVLMFRRIKYTAERAPNDYARFLVSGILIWLSVQMIINVGAMLGLIPLKGITLPFVSYGGTSIIFVMAAVGIVFHVSKYTDLSKSVTHRSYGQPEKRQSTRAMNSRRQWGGGDENR